MEKEYIYYVTAISISEITEEILQKKYQIHSIKYDNKMTYEKYVLFKKRWNDDRYFFFYK